VISVPIKHLRLTRDVDQRRITKVAVIDEHSFTRECITRALQELGEDLAVVPFANSAAFLGSSREFHLVICHWQRSGTKERVSEHLKEITTKQPVIILSPVSQPNFIRDAFEQGVRGYIPTENTTLDLAIEIIRLVKAGGTFVPISSLPLQDNTDQPDSRQSTALAQFTSREAAVLELLSRGKANRVIAKELHVSESTVKANVRSILRKLKANNRTEAVWRAITSGLLMLGICYLG
jgi:DNA-binding NarL/FixJ family response regulator